MKPYILGFLMKLASASNAFIFESVSQSEELFPGGFCPQRGPEGISGRGTMTAVVSETWLLSWYYVGTKQKRCFLVLNPTKTNKKPHTFYMWTRLSQADFQECYFHKIVTNWYSTEKLILIIIFMQITVSWQSENPAPMEANLFKLFQKVATCYSRQEIWPLASWLLHFCHWYSRLFHYWVFEGKNIQDKGRKHLRIQNKRNSLRKGIEEEWFNVSIHDLVSRTLTFLCTYMEIWRPTLRVKSLQDHPEILMASSPVGIIFSSFNW